MEVLQRKLQLYGSCIFLLRLRLFLAAAVVILGDFLLLFCFCVVLSYIFPVVVCVFCFSNKLLHCFLYVFCSCICPDGYDGPRCQKTKVSFSGAQSYMFLKPLESCETDRLSLELITSTSDALVLFNGPMSAADSSIFTDYIAMQLSGGYPKLRINLGEGELLLPEAGSNNLLKVNDGKWHTLEVFHDGQVVFSELICLI